jgi:hypothetical protein
MSLSDPTPTSPLSSLPRRPEPRSRRRRRGQLKVPQDAAGRAALLASLAHRAYPTYELFVYAALSGAIVGLGYILDSQALLLFGILVAPLMVPWIGLLLAAITGSLRFFFDTLMALLMAAVIVFLIGILSGFAARAVLPHTFDEAFNHSRLWWPDLIVLAIGAVILTVSFVRSEAKPFLPSVILAYEFFLPLAAGGFGLGSGLGELWPYGVLVFAVHFAWACMFGLITLAALRIMPSSAQAFVFSAAVAFILLAVLVVLMSTGNWTSAFVLSQPASGAAGLPTHVAALPSPATEAAIGDDPTSTAAAFDTPLPATFVPTRERTATPTITLTIAPTPVYALIHADKGGAILRETPGGKGLTTLDNFSYVEMLPETEEVSGYTWQHVVAIQSGNRREGWVVQLYLETATPAAQASPGALPSPTTTP